MNISATPAVKTILNHDLLTTLILLSIPTYASAAATAGLYDGAGDWLYNTGTPAKSGVGGGIVAVIPGKLAIGVFAPPLDSIGNSVKGQLAATYIINKLGLNPYNQ